MKIKRIFDLVPLLLMWLMLSVFLWGLVFNNLTDTAPEKKIALFVDAPVPGAVELAVKMESLGAEGIEMVKVHPFTYAMMDGKDLENADLYIVQAANAESYKDWFAPLPEGMGPGDTLAIDGTVTGLKVDNPAEAYIDYAEGDYYLFFGKNSRHLTDDLAAEYARFLLTIDEGGH